MTIGKVEEVKVGQYGFTSTAIIKPAAGFQDWKELFVVYTEERVE